MQKMRAKAKKPNRVKEVREHRLVCRVSDRELRILESFLAKYKVKNKGRWMRETLLSKVYKTMLINYPSLFDKQE
ncbi:MAG: hypothetical protein MJZ69_00220 [Bacteroidaceae bacterium]|nr:hypothetical protein [Bacteroidaceae bacterium]MDO4957063.1 hypothetical protein [Bacteroidales bacterium]